MRGRYLTWSALLLAGLALAPTVSQAGHPKTLLETIMEPVEIPEPEEGLAPSVVRGQDATGYALPDVFIPSPLSSTRPEVGLFGYGTFTMYTQTMTLGQQTVAVRGFFDLDGRISGTPGTTFGSGATALSTKQVTGPQYWQPGFKIGGGYRFEDGSIIETSWLHFSSAHYVAVATPIPQNLKLDPSLADSFLSAPVNNFPLDFAGPLNDVNGQAAFGIWNAADLMHEEFDQRNEFYEVIYKLAPIIDTLEWRTYGFFGPRFVWFWERYLWRTFDFDANGAQNSSWNAFYTNIVSNRLYGMKIGCGNDWYIGNGFSTNCDIFGTPMLDVYKTRAKYERGDRGYGPENKRADTDYTPALEGGISMNLNWFPYEGIQLKASYNYQVYLNTITMDKPIDFDYSALTPHWEHQILRQVHGWEIGVCFRF
jgi:hypothetical protein